MTTLPSLTNTRHERRATDSIIQVGRPEPSYQPTRAKAKDEAGPLVLNHLTYEDVIRERVRAFAFRPSSIYSHTPSRAKRTSIISNV